MDTTEHKEEEENYIRVCYKIPLDSEICTSLTFQLIKNLLYLRGQIPCAYSVLEEYMEKQLHNSLNISQQTTSKLRKQPLGPIKKAQKLLAIVDKTLRTSLFSLFQSTRVVSIVIVFGASIIRPREVYFINFGLYNSKHEQEQDVEYRASLLSRCEKKLIRTLVSESITRMNFTLPNTTLHIMALAHASDIPIQGFLPNQFCQLKVPHDKTYYFSIEGNGIISKPCMEHLQQLTNITESKNLSIFTTKEPMGAYLNIPSSSMQLISSKSLFEEHAAHLNWRKLCIDQSIKATLQESKERYQRDMFQHMLRSTELAKVEKQNWMQDVITSEMTKPLPISPLVYNQLTTKSVQDMKHQQSCNDRHRSQVEKIQKKIQERADWNKRRLTFELKKKALT